jgi:uncharacterized protein YjbJ (UPF0337 family)
MTDRSSDADKRTAEATGGSAGAGAADASTQAAVKRKAKGSVHEAIGKLIGDDQAREHGTAEKEAGAADASKINKSSQP